VTSCLVCDGPTSPGDLEVWSNWGRSYVVHRSLCAAAWRASRRDPRGRPRRLEDAANLAREALKGFSS
jgi:hypothetical protein